MVRSLFSSQCFALKTHVDTFCLVLDLISSALLTNTHLLTDTSLALMFASDLLCVWRISLRFTAIFPECSHGLFPFPRGSSFLGHCWLHQYLLILLDILGVCIQAVKESNRGHQTLANMPCQVLESLYNKERGRQWHSDCPVYHGTNRKEVITDTEFTEARERDGLLTISRRVS